MLFDLFILLGASDEQADFPIIYASAKQGFAIKNLTDEQKDMTPLFEAILAYVPEAPQKENQPFRMQIVNLGYDNFLGRLGIGRVYEGTVKPGAQVNIYDREGKLRTGKISKIFNTLGVQRIEQAEAQCGDIITISGIPNIFVGETVSVGEVEALPSISIDEPTLKMEFLVNDSPFAGKEGKYMTTRNLEERLQKELETNVGLKVDFDEGKFMVSGRGELHLGVLIESIRREGWELQVGAPQVIFREIDGIKQEPIEQLVVSVEDQLSGGIIEAINNRKGLMKTMNSINGLTTIEFEIPTR
jgi:GTP-binding protein